MSFHPIQAHSNLNQCEKLSSKWNDVGMTEWCRNDRHLRFQFFSPPPKTTSFLLIPSFQHHSAIPQMKRDENYNGGDFIQESFQSFKLHSDQSCHSRNDGMRRNEGRFLNQGQTLNSENLLIPLSFRHSISLLYSSHGHSFHLKAIPAIWGSFLIPMSFEFEVDLKFIPCRRYTAFASKKFNPVLSPYRRQHQIKSFRGHSNPFKLIPISFKVENQWSNWNDCGMKWNVVWMI